MRKYLLPLLHPFMTAFEACPFNFLLEKPAKNCFTFVKVPILLLTGSVRVRFGFGDFSSGSGSVRPNQKILVRSTTNPHQRSATTNLRSEIKLLQNQEVEFT